MGHFQPVLACPGKDLETAQSSDPLIAGQAHYVIHQSDHILCKALHPETRAR